MKKSGQHAPFISTVGRYFPLLAALVALMLYLPTVNYEYALDDGMYIMQNSLTQGGIGNLKAIFTTGSIHDFNTNNGPEPWRPLTITTFAIGKSLWDNLPFAEHLINVFLYALTAVMLFQLIRKLLPSVQENLLFAGTLLFVVHPIHTEVVANVKGRDEILCLFFTIASWHLWVSPCNNIARKCGAALCLFGALLSKETAIVFTLLIPLSGIMLLRLNIKEVIGRSWLLWGVAIIFMTMRQSVTGGSFEAETGDPVNNIIYAAESNSEYAGTVIYLFGLYLFKTLWPYPLLHDYSLHYVSVTDMADIMVWLVIAAMSVLFYLIFKYRKKIPPVSFGIFFFLTTLTPTANIFFLNGASFAERFLYIPVLGVCAVAIPSFLSVSSFIRSGLLVVGIVISIFTLITLQRIPDWKNNEKLFESGAQIAPDNARIRASLAFDYKERAFESRNVRQQAEYFKKAEREFLVSRELNAEFHYSTYNLGVMYYETGQKDKAERIYKEGVAKFTEHRDMHNNLGVIYFENSNYLKAKEMFSRAIEIDSNDANAWANLGACLQNTGQPELAEPHYLKAIALNPLHKGALGNLVLIYRGRGEVEKANYYESLRK